MTGREIFESVRKSKLTIKPNYLQIPVTTFDMNEGGVTDFNMLVDYLNREYCVGFNKIVRTSSGGISVERSNFRLPMWDTRTLNSCVELTVLGGDGFFRAQLRTKSKKDNKFLSGRLCFIALKSMLRENGIILENYAISNGKEVKDTIPKPKICLYRQTFKDKIFDNVHHIDLNSSYFSGIADAFPEFRPTIEHIYSLRKKNSKYKEILNRTQGFMQSKMVGFKYAHISKAGIVSNCERIDRLSDALISQGFIILMYNTDGIWYTHPDGKMYHDDNEGTALGQWKHDHVNCKFQAKSDGAYHFIENGKCYTKLRGTTLLDKTKPRDEWTWEDLYSKDQQVIKVSYNDEEGAKIRYEEEI